MSQECGPRPQWAGLGDTRWLASSRAASEHTRDSRALAPACRIVCARRRDARIAHVHPTEWAYLTMIGLGDGGGNWRQSSWRED